MMNLARKIIIVCSLLAFLQAGFAALGTFQSPGDAKAAAELSVQSECSAQTEQLAAASDEIDPSSNKLLIAIKQRPRAKRAATLLAPVESLQIFSGYPLTPGSSDGTSPQLFCPLLNQVQRQLRFTVLLV